jgi:hypothetical protein
MGLQTVRFENAVFQELKVRLAGKVFFKVTIADE